MVKKVSPNKESAHQEGDTQPKAPGMFSKMAGVWSKVFGVIKFILGICLLPFVYSSTVALLQEFGLIEKVWQHYFWLGAGSFLVLYLFIWEPAKIYTKGFQLVEILFTFFKPLIRVAPYLLPVYTIILLLLYAVCSLFIKENWLLQDALFLLGFTITLHLVFSAKSIRGKKEDFLKSNYIFGFSFVYLISLLLQAIFVNLVFKEFSIVHFANNSYQIAADIFHAVFKQLFLR